MMQDHSNSGMNGAALMTQSETRPPAAKGRRLTSTSGTSDRDDDPSFYSSSPSKPIALDREAYCDPSEGSFHPNLRPPHQFRTRQLEAPHTPVRTNDEVHSTIFLCPVTKAIVDTPHFQRLRGLKQLGLSEYTYMNCNHTRFEHSLGVAHLAQKMCRHILQNQPNLGCAPKDVLAVSLAGLLHDLGHAAFSHVFEQFLHQELPLHFENHPHLLHSSLHYKGLPPLDPSWTHEDASLMMIESLLKYLGLAIDYDNLDEPLKQIGDGIDCMSMRVFDNNITTEELSPRDAVLTSRDFIFIQECIVGHPIRKVQQKTNTLTHGFVGRPGWDKGWLYDIVHNRHSGLDVDKIDYFARDSRRAKRASGEIEHRLIDEAVVAKGQCPDPRNCFQCQIKQNTHLMIVYPQKMASHILKFFLTRRDLHEAIYTHHTTEAAGYMVCDILCLADPYFRISTQPGGIILAKTGYKEQCDDDDPNASPLPDSLPLSRSMWSEYAYLRVRDNILAQIANTTDPQLEPARQLIARLWSRDLYKMAGEIELDIAPPSQDYKEPRRTKTQIAHEKLLRMSENEMKEKMLFLKGQHGTNEGEKISLDLDDFIVKKLKIHCGQKDKNPVLCVRFLEPSHMSKLRNKPLTSLPTATEPSESLYKRSLPREFQTHFIRVFSRTTEKKELVEHVFNAFLSWVLDDGLHMTGECLPEDTPQGTILTQEDNMGDDEYDDDGNDIFQTSETPRQKRKLQFDLDGSEARRTPGRRNLGDGSAGEEQPDSARKSVLSVTPNRGL